ncbi:hypothetical protein ABBQ32_000075 [Trebouxia sp. C0010 RCD-2024]
MPCQHHCQTPRQLPCPTVITSQSLPSAPRFQRRQLLSPARKSNSHAKRVPHLKARRKDSPLLPVMIPTGEDGQEVTDMFTHMLRNRIIFVGQRITDELATQIVASLLALEAGDEAQDIQLYINSQGGSPYATIAILDVMDAIKCDISTVAFGMCASTATLLLAAGTKGKRYAMPSTRIMMHQPAGGAMGSADEVNIQASELNRTMKVINRFLSRFTGMTTDEIEVETDRDNFLSPQTAIEKGVIDRILQR